MRENNYVTLISFLDVVVVNIVVVVVNIVVVVVNIVVVVNVVL